MTEFYAVIDRDEGGQFFAYVPELPGCHTCGETMEELLENLEEAIALYLARSRQGRGREGPDFYSRPFCRWYFTRERPSGRLRCVLRTRWRVRPTFAVWFPISSIC